MYIFNMDKIYFYKFIVRKRDDIIVCSNLIKNCMDYIDLKLNIVNMSHHTII